MRGRFEVEGFSARDDFDQDYSWHGSAEHYKSVQHVHSFASLRGRWRVLRTTSCLWEPSSDPHWVEIVFEKQHRRSQAVFPAHICNLAASTAAWPLLAQ